MSRNLFAAKLRVLMPESKTKANCERLRGSVTIYLAMTFMCMVTLIFALLESAHTAGNSYYLQNAADAAIDSVFSEYDNALWNHYRIFAYNLNDSAETESDYKSYMEPYMWIDNYFCLTDAAVSLDKTYSIASEGAYYFEQEIIDYMKTGIVENQLQSETGGVKKLAEDIEDAQEIEEAAEAYTGVSKLAVELEDIVAKIDKNLKEQQSYKTSMVKALAKRKVSTFRSSSSSLLTRMRALPGLVRSYKTREDALKTALASANSKNKGRYDELTEVYGDYVYDARLRRDDIDYVDDEMSYYIEEIKWAREEVSERQREAREAEPKETAEYDDIADDLDWIIDIPELDVEYGVGDSGTESLIERISSLVNGNLLELVLPYGKTVSTSWIPQNSLPSGTAVSSRSKSGRSPLENYEIAMYATDYFADFTDYDSFGKLDEEIKAQRLGGEICYELEYILADDKSDRENLCTACRKVMALREGLNFMHIMSDSAKRNEAEELAAVIVGSAGMPALIPLVATMIIAAWAAAEATADVRSLLDGGEIPLVKDDSDWQLDLDGVLSLGRSGRLAGTTPVSSTRNKVGLSSSRGAGSDSEPDWETYLKYLLMTENSSDRNYRMLDLIQDNVRTANSDFSVVKAVYAMKFTVEAKGRHLFSVGGNYSVKVQTSKAY